MPTDRYANTQRHPITLAGGRTVAAGASFNATDDELGELVRDGTVFDTQAGHGIASEEQVNHVNVVQHEPTAEQAAAQQAHEAQKAAAAAEERQANSEARTRSRSKKGGAS